LRSFSALQRAENSSIAPAATATVCCTPCFSALQRAENSSIELRQKQPRGGNAVSVLFSEPKIPQFKIVTETALSLLRFQCSSASRKFLNQTLYPRLEAAFNGFSALQRAENSSIGTDAIRAAAAIAFQCSSASRKFLNGVGIAVTGATHTRFSALQRAENSSRLVGVTTDGVQQSFSALQRAENSSTNRRTLRTAPALAFQCSSASRKFLNGCYPITQVVLRGFSALQRAENSSIVYPNGRQLLPNSFSALQRAENSSIAPRSRQMRFSSAVSVLFSEPKIPQVVDETNQDAPGMFQCSSASRKFLNGAAD